MGWFAIKCRGIKRAKRISYNNDMGPVGVAGSYWFLMAGAHWFLDPVFIPLFTTCYHSLWLTSLLWRLFLTFLKAYLSIKPHICLMLFHYNNINNLCMFSHRFLYLFEFKITKKIKKKPKSLFPSYIKPQNLWSIEVERLPYFVSVQICLLSLLCCFMQLFFHFYVLSVKRISIDFVNLCTKVNLKYLFILQQNSYYLCFSTIIYMLFNYITSLKCIHMNKFTRHEFAFLFLKKL